MRRLTLIFVLAAVLAPPAAAQLTLGVYGPAARFRTLTGQKSEAKHIFVRWNVSFRWLQQVFDEHAPRPLVAVMTRSKSGREAITPRGIARGLGDRYLVKLNIAAHRFRKPSYIRVMPEMNGSWNPFCAYNENGTKRGAAHSQKAFRNAFRRIYVFVHGGSRAEMNAKLKSFHMRGVGRNLPENPQVTVIWNPQGFGSPNVRGNMPAAYWPGKRYVDMVGNDLYDMHGRVTWEANAKLYRQFPSRPYSFPEWGLWAIDDPGFIRAMARWVKTHRRVQLLSWYNGPNGSIFDLKSKPASRRAYRRLITPLG